MGKVSGLQTMPPFVKNIQTNNDLIGLHEYIKTGLSRWW